MGRGNLGQSLADLADHGDRVHAFFAMFAAEKQARQIGAFFGGSGENINGSHLVSPCFVLPPVRFESLIGVIRKERAILKGGAIAARLLRG